MPTHKWKEIVDKMSPERREKLDMQVKQELKELEKAEFIRGVILKVRAVDELGDEAVKRQAGFLFDDGYSLEDAIAYLKCTEEVNPNLDEDTALARMHEIYIKYHK